MTKERGSAFEQFIRAVLLPVGLSIACGACSDEPEFDFTHQAGEQCEGCEACDDTGLFSHCQCDTCIDTAYDPTKLELLDCISGSWVVRLECPGGVSVECAGKGGYHVTCLDENGDELL